MVENKYYEVTRFSKYVSKQVDALQGVKTQREISMDAGFKAVNMISMIKRGEIRPSLDKVPRIARALRVDPYHMCWLALEDYLPEVYEVIKTDDPKINADELELIKGLRDLKGGELDTNDIEKVLTAITSAGFLSKP